MSSEYLFFITKNLLASMMSVVDHKVQFKIRRCQSYN